MQKIIIMLFLTMKAKILDTHDISSKKRYIREMWRSSGKGKRKREKEKRKEKSNKKVIKKEKERYGKRLIERKRNVGERIS